MPPPPRAKEASIAAWMAAESSVVPSPAAATVTARGSLGVVASNDADCAGPAAAQAESPSHAHATRQSPDDLRRVMRGLMPTDLPRFQLRQAIPDKPRRSTSARRQSVLLGYSA